MTEEQQRIAIAQDVLPQQKWERILDPDGKTWVIGYRYPAGRGYILAPDYLHDLNAMHEVLATLLSDGNWRKFIWWLEHILKLGHMEDGCVQRETTTEMMLINATAAQRAEAFLRVKGLWLD